MKWCHIIVINPQLLCGTWFILTPAINCLTNVGTVKPQIKQKKNKVFLKRDPEFAPVFLNVLMGFVLFNVLQITCLHVFSSVFMFY